MLILKYHKKILMNILNMKFLFQLNIDHQIPIKYLKVLVYLI